MVYGVSVAVLLAATLALYLAYGRQLTEFVSDTESFKAWLESYKELGAVIFVLIRAFQTVIKIIPAEPLEIAAGYVFGTWGGLALCSLGTFLGSLVIVFLADKIGSKFVAAFVNEDALKNISLINNKKNQRLFLFVFYLVPSTPKDILTYVAGSLKVNLWEFFIITSVARIPSIITSTICGSQLEKNNIPAAAAVFIATAVVSVVCALIFKKQNSATVQKA